METLSDLSKKFGINVEYASVAFYPVFRAGVAGCRVLLVSDENTCRYAAPFAEKLRGYGIAAEEFVLPAREPVADEATCATVEARAKGACDYVLAVGAGTINDIVKYVTFRLGLPCGVLATAASMDGYASGVTPLIRKGVKVTENAHTVRDILLDTEILRTAPPPMTGAGVGDILAKYCCLTDWKLASLLKGEAVDADAMALMRGALEGCVAALPAIRAGGSAGLGELMRALLVSGYAMVLAGNSRPASGAEHHMSHFLEMDFLRRGKPVPLHGIKVGLGTLVSLHLYKRIAALQEEFAGKAQAAALAVPLPSPEFPPRNPREAPWPVVPRPPKQPKHPKHPMESMESVGEAGNRARGVRWVRWSRFPWIAPIAPRLSAEFPPRNPQEAAWEEVRERSSRV